SGAGVVMVFRLGGGVDGGWGVGFGPAARPRRSDQRGENVLLVRRLADEQEIVFPEGHVQPVQLATHGRQQLAHGFGAILRLGDHAGDGLTRVIAPTDEDRHGFLPWELWCRGGNIISACSRSMAAGSSSAALCSAAYYCSLLRWLCRGRHVDVGVAFK